MRLPRRLVAGRRAISQAVQELTELELERERIAEATSKVERPPPVSVWWWLLPPAKMYLEHRRNDAFRERYVAALHKDDVEALLTFFNKADILARNA